MMMIDSFQRGLAWLKRQDGRIILVWIVGALMLLSLCLMFAWFAMDLKTVTLVVDGESYEVKTRQKHVSSLLKENEIELKDQDRLSKPRSSRLRNGDVIVIERAFPIRLVDGGQESFKYTAASNVAEALRDLDITLGKEDEVYPDLQEPIKENATIRIVRVERTLATKEETIPFRTLEQKDDRMLKGERKVIQEGKDGKRVKTIEQVWKDGKLVSEQVVKDVVQVERQDRIVAVGTQNPVQILSASSPNIDQITRDGVTFQVKKIIDNVTLTAYDAGFNSTGKTKDHPAYGITHTGSVVKEGRTAAVDPEVIPLGWWFYIEGIGFRRAEDTGSAVKGKKIDLYMDSEEEANQFGMKKGYTVYVIGPEKPSAL